MLCELVFRPGSLFGRSAENLWKDELMQASFSVTLGREPNPGNGRARLASMPNYLTANEMMLEGRRVDATTEAQQWRCERTRCCWSPTTGAGIVVQYHRFVAKSHFDAIYLALIDQLLVTFKWNVMWRKRPPGEGCSGGFRRRTGECQTGGRYRV